MMDDVSCLESFEVVGVSRVVSSVCTEGRIGREGGVAKRSGAAVRGLCCCGCA